MRCPGKGMALQNSSFMGPFDFENYLYTNVRERSLFMGGGGGNRGEAKISVQAN